MTASVPNYTEKEWAGDGSTTAFSFQTKVLESADLKVWLVEDGVATLKTLGTHYTLSGVGESAGVTVTFLTEPTITQTVRVRRETSPKQTVDYTNLGKVPGDTTETQLDRLAMHGQDVDTRVGAIEDVIDDLGGYDDLSDVLTQASGFADEAEAAKDAALAAVPGAFPPTRTDLAELADTTENAFLTEEGYQGFFKQTDVSGGTYDDLIAADTVGGEIKVKDPTTSLAYLRQRKTGDLFKTSEFGGGVSGLKIALAVASEWATLRGADVYADVLINEFGTLAFQSTDTGLIIPPNVNLLGMGKGQTVLDIAAVNTPNLIDHTTGEINSSGRRFMDVRPAYGSFDALYSVLPSFQAINARETYIDFDSDPGLVIGDVLIVYTEADSSWLPSRPEYRKGDRFEVLGVDGNRVYLDHAFRDAYTYNATAGSEVKAWKQTVRTGRMSGFTIDASGSGVATLEGLAINSCKGFRLDDLEFIDFGENGFQLNQCFNSHAYDCDATTTLSNGTLSVYPFSFRNSTRCSVNRAILSGDWHGGDWGGYNLFGATLNYDCWYNDCSAHNSGQGSSQSSGFNAHGNSDFCGARRCKTKGLIMAGRDFFFEDGEIILGGDAGDEDALLQLGEFHSGIARVSRTKMRTSRAGSTSFGGEAISLLADGDTQAEVFVELHDVDLDAPSALQPVRMGAISLGAQPVSLSFRGRANVPAASDFVTIVNGNTALTASYFDISDIRGLDSGVGFASSTAGAGGHMGFSEWKFPRQSGIWTTAAVAVAQETSAYINFDHSFPSTYSPRASITRLDNAKGNKAATGAYSITTTAIRPQIANGDGTNMKAAASNVAWEVW